MATYLAIKQNQAKLLSNVNVLCEITQKAADIFSGRSILEELLSDLLRPSYNGEFMPELPFAEPGGEGIPSIPMPVIPIPTPFLY